MELPPVDALHLNTTGDTLYSHPKATHKSLDDTKPWLKDPYYFKTIRISAVALTKMVMHARSGGSLEVMGLMTGYAVPPTQTSPASIVVTDAFRLPVEGTETRVNAQDEANEYIVEYLRAAREGNIAQEENAVGWYHSHPGYGCWLSGIDVSTQALQQKFNEPFVAVVVDPDRTVSANKVEIGAFRTLPEGFVSSAVGGAVGQDGAGTVPMAKAEDFGAHSSKYYSLEVEHFKSSLDAGLLEGLWNKYWVQTLAQNPLLTNREYSSSQMLDLASKIGEIAGGIRRGAGQVGSVGGRGGAPAAGPGGGSGGGGGGGSGSGSGSGSTGGAGWLGTTASAGQGGGGGGGGGGGVVGLAKGPIDRSLEKVVQDVKTVAAKERAGLVAAEVKANVFTCGCDSSRNQK